MHHTIPETQPDPIREPPKPEQPAPSRRALRFSFKTLLLIIAFVAVYLGGRFSMQRWSAPRTGTYLLRLTSGHEDKVPITALVDGDYLLNWGSNSVFGGTYRWKAGKLVVVTPTDKRYTGLVWQWEGDDLVLVGEPPNHPAGQTYLGARLHFLSPDTSEAYPRMNSQK